jgi:LmbE family N-acetylglucosaminyl deacetylase
MNKFDLLNMADSSESVALFIFAHQDDEFGVFQKIIDERQKGHRVCCAYLTDGGFGGVSPKRRNQESLYVLEQLDVKEQDVFFAGQALGIPDGQLHKHLVSAADWISEWLTGFSQVVSVCVPAWEGGHHDHDALHAITVCIAEAKGILGNVRQFSLYNGYGCPSVLFKVLAPLSMNGAVEETRIPWKNRLRFLRYCLCYPSQTITWLGLFPFVVFHYLVNGKQQLQPVSLERISCRPHEGALYYEKRDCFTWEKMVVCLDEWRNKCSNKN